MTKYYFVLIYIIVGSLLTTSIVFAQNNKADSLFSSVQIGSKLYYNVKMKDGIVYKARIVSVDTESVLLLLPGDKSNKVATREIIEVNREAHNSPGSVGIGFGLPYGVIGANLDIKLVSVLNLTAGIGTGIFVTPMYNVGMKCFLRSGNYKFRPRIMANYGTTSLLYIEDYNGDVVEQESYNGLSLAAGFQWALNITNSVGIDFDIIYIVDDSEIEAKKVEYINEGYDLNLNATNNIKFSLGLRYIF